MQGYVVVEGEPPLIPSMCEALHCVRYPCVVYLPPTHTIPRTGPGAPLDVPFQVPLWVVPPARLRPLPGMQFAEVVRGPQEAQSPPAAACVDSYPVAQVRRWPMRSDSRHVQCTCSPLWRLIDWRIEKSHLLELRHVKCWGAGRAVPHWALNVTPAHRGCKPYVSRADVPRPVVGHGGTLQTLGRVV